MRWVSSALNVEISTHLVIKSYRRDLAQFFLPISTFYWKKTALSLHYYKIKRLSRPNVLNLDM